MRLAAFDFDGTALDGNSPVILVKFLARRRMLNPSVVLRIGLWAAAYKLRLPQNEAWVRGLVFRALRANRWSRSTSSCTTSTTNAWGRACVRWRGRPWNNGMSRA